MNKLLTFLLLLLLFLILCNFNQSGYKNYRELSYKGSKKNCPSLYSQRYKSLINNYQMIQPFGYTKNELLEETKLIRSDVPLPTDPDFFRHI